MKYPCQGPNCHTRQTKDRFNKSTKRLKGRNAYFDMSHGYRPFTIFCTTGCQNDWINDNIEHALNHFGRTTEVKHLTEENAWYKSYDWNSNYDNRTYVIRNGITKEQRPLTEEQYNDTNYTLNER